MKIFDFIQATISHNLKDPHSNALELDCLSPRLAIATHPLEGEGTVGGKINCCVCNSALQTRGKSGGL
jgi:hypothetical protein